MADLELTEGLPAGPDPEVLLLSARDRAGLARVWEWRARAELRAAGAFARLTAELVQRTRFREVQVLASRAVADEIRHAEICRKMAELYGERDVPWPELKAEPLPQFGEALPAFNLTLNVVLSACLSETVAAELLRRCHAAAKGRAARWALRELLKDEIEHARLGWAHVAAIDAAERLELAVALPTLIQLARQAWTAPSPVPAGLPLGHGWVDDEEVLRTFDEVLADVIRPGFAHLGVE
jgi:hypothetical protein